MNDESDFKYDVFVPEHTKTNKFIAHVSITDKDANENGRVDWMILINEKVFESKQNFSLLIILNFSSKNKRFYKIFKI